MEKDNWDKAGIIMSGMASIATVGLFFLAIITVPPIQRGVTGIEQQLSEGQVAGGVTNESHVQLPGATVTLFLDIYGDNTDFVPAVDINGNTVPSKITNKDGMYAFTGVPRGKYKVIAMLRGQSGFAYPVIITGGTTTADVIIVGAVVP